MPLQLSTNVAAIALTAGLGGIAVECNRPGLILPGCAGLLTVLVATASLSRAPFHPWPAAMLVLCLVALLAHTRRRMAGWVGAPLTLLWIAAWRALFAPPDRIAWPVAVLCGIASGGLGWWLTGIALRARQAKALPNAIN